MSLSRQSIAGVSNARLAAPIAVGYLHNTNGMAAWCWEAAHALHELGREVILFASLEAHLPGSPAVEVVRIAPRTPPNRSLHVPNLVRTAMNILSSRPDGILNQIHTNLVAQGRPPAAYVLNQSTLVDRWIARPQFVAAWSFPIDLLSYLQKTPRLISGLGAKGILTTSLGLLGWWRKDWRAYRDATKVLCVTEVLNNSLLSRSIPCTLAHPGTCVAQTLKQADTGRRILMAAGDLVEPRKRIRWMLEAMSQLNSAEELSLQLAGSFDDSIRNSATKLSLGVEFLGRLDREELARVMQQAHIFCFGSLLDDWGYVLVEAMANGLIPVVPTKSPFDEIVGDTGFCYDPHDPRSFLSALKSAINVDIDQYRQRVWRRAEKLFSRLAFGQSILGAMSCL